LRPVLGRKYSKRTYGFWGLPGQQQQVSRFTKCLLNSVPSSAIHAPPGYAVAEGAARGWMPDPHRLRDEGSHRFHGSFFKVDAWECWVLLPEVFLTRDWLASRRWNGVCRDSWLGCTPKAELGGVGRQSTCKLLGRTASRTRQGKYA
jgi:hypothetical protein